MSLSYRPGQQLRRVKVAVCRSDPHLAAMFGVFGRAECGQRHACLGEGGPRARRPEQPPAKPLAAPRRSAAAARSARAHAHRVMTAHPVEVAARAQRNTEGSPSGSSFRGQPPGDARLRRAQSATYRSRFAAAPLQVHVRGRLGEILPGPAASSPDAARCADPASPRPGVPSLLLAMTGHFGGFGPGLGKAMAS
jgi:hypothetical protein